MLAPLASIVAALVVAGDVSVSPARGDRGNTSFARALAVLDRPSDRTRETLRRYGVDGVYRHDVPLTLSKLENFAKADPQTDLVFALAELSWIEAKRLDHRRKGEALDRYVDAVAYAYDFLFAPEVIGDRNPSDPRFRDACNLYNGGLDRLIRAAQANPKSGRIEPDGVLKFKVHGREQLVRIFLDATKTPWKPEDVDEIILCSDFEVSGLPGKTYVYGLGVPLIAVRKSEKDASPREKFYPAEMAFPLTAFLRPNSRLRDADVNNLRECTLELVDPVRVRTVPAGPSMPVESDLTTPLAYMWSKSDLSKFRWSGLLRPEANLERAGLMLIRPYERGKIPVVMVHGLASTPLAWVPMINDLLRDPRINENYQFMLYLYPTGIPFPIAAAGLRDTLGAAAREFNPDGSDPAFDKMVLLGHSMGGLLAHAVVVESGDNFWKLYSHKRFRDVVGPTAVIDELRRYMIFPPVPSVKRVVYLAVPHRGSDLSRSFVGRVGAGLINDPDHVSKLFSELVKQNPDAFDRRQFRRLPTSIETLETNGRMLLALLAMKPAPDVVFHSIIGTLRPGPSQNTSDGVVPYTSSHLDGVESELVVNSDHGVQANAEAIREVQRILIDHLDVRGRGVAVGEAKKVD